MQEITTFEKNFLVTQEIKQFVHNLAEKRGEDFEFKDDDFVLSTSDAIDILETFFSEEDYEGSYESWFCCYEGESPRWENGGYDPSGKNKILHEFLDLITELSNNDNPPTTPMIN